MQLAAIRVPDLALDEAHAQASSSWLTTLERVADNIRRFHRDQRQAAWYMDKGDGETLGQRILPMERVGLYVPGGTAAYPSSVLMTA